MDSRTIEYLKSVLGDFVKEPRLIVVAGHPGAGKTTLASIICLHAMQTNEKCLYMSFQEDKNRLFKQLAGVGIALDYFDAKGLLRFIKLPIPGDEEAVHIFMNEMLKSISDFNPRIIVIDSITALFKGLRDDVKIRGYLQNLFWELQKIVLGSIVMVVEVALGQEYPSLGDIEFIADAILILKHRIDEGLIERFMEIRKIRGRELLVAEIPFSIRGVQGIVLHPPVIPREIKSIAKSHLKLKRVNNEYEFEEVRKPVHVTLIEFTPQILPSTCLLLSILMHAPRNEKILIISYKHSEDELKHYIIDVFRKYADEETIERVLNRIVIRAVNPLAYSIYERTAMELSLVDEVKPGAVVFYNSSLPLMLESNKERYLRTLFNETLALKSRGVEVILAEAKSPPELSTIKRMLADSMIHIDCIDNYCLDYTVRIVEWGEETLLTKADVEKLISKLLILG
ncbi:ATPase domain-containing protein [Ignisphaera sp. 4213-co]|uniref:ATPase domain-containing protein n=1 Tax=Ignisphaera cupida TaxID=3050454 RepID=A0ABD4Z6X4_9CREN|nr:ATPase domain-containing protein [Ignisphaera sp. 4213-co]MDK6028697.1 ATPase domain-containing protein [Ignisphaera sp. 4213-co]